MDASEQVPDRRGVTKSGTAWKALLVLIVALFLAVRLPWAGHLLTWDEAITLCGYRAFAAGGTDYYAGWFWRHPPLLSLLFLALRPLAPGFDVRVEWLTALLAAGACLALFALNARVLGRATALWAAFFLALMPGAMFYDVWVKQDVGVSLFGLLALYLFVGGRPLWSGMSLGLAFLSKELAVFYAVALGLVGWLRRGPRRFSELGWAYGVTALTAGWWYVLFSTSVRGFWRFATDPSFSETRAFRRPWYYFLQRLPLDLGWWGLALVLAGILALLLEARRPSRTPREGGHDAAGRHWPLALLLPSYIVVSAMPGKALWHTISLFPAWATLGGAGMVWILHLLHGEGLQRRRQILGAAAAAIVLVLALSARLGADHEAWLRAREPGYWWGADASRLLARQLNELVQEGETVLITPLHYWKGGAGVPCPIVAYYLKDVPVVVRRRDIPAEALVETVRQYKISWAVVSPDPGESERALVGPLMERYGLRPRVVGGALVFKTDSLWKSGEQSREVSKE